MLNLNLFHSDNKKVEEIPKAKDALTNVMNLIKPTKSKKDRMKEKSLKWKEKMDSLKQGKPNCSTFDVNLQ